MTDEKSLAHTVAFVLAMIAILFIYVKAASMQFEDEQKLFNFYCEQIESGNWPDYKELKHDCDQRPARHP